MNKAHGSLMLAALASVSLVSLDAFGTDEEEGTKPETYALKGGVYHVIPDELLRQKGLVFPNVPRDQNAAYDYLAALEAYGSMRGKHKLCDLRDRAIRDGWPTDAQPADESLLVEYLDANTDVLALLERAATKPGCHFPFFAGGDELPKVADDIRVSELPLPHL